LYEIGKRMDLDQSYLPQNISQDMYPIARAIYISRSLMGMLQSHSKAGKLLLDQVQILLNYATTYPRLNLVSVVVDMFANMIEMEMENDSVGSVFLLQTLLGILEVLAVNLNLLNEFVEKYAPIYKSSSAKSEETVYSIVRAFMTELLNLTNDGELDPRFIDNVIDSFNYIYSDEELEQLFFHAEKVHFERKTDLSYAVHKILYPYFPKYNNTLRGTFFSFLGIPYIKERLSYVEWGAPVVAQLDNLLNQ